MRYPFNQLCYIAGILMFFMTLTEILRPVPAALPPW